MKKPILLIFITYFFFLALPWAEAALGIEAFGGWNQSIGASDLSAGAGSDLNSTYSSVNNSTLINITGAQGVNRDWRVDVNRVGGSWDANLRIYVRRTGDGTGTGTVSDGLNYIEATTTGNYFFQGSDLRSSIPVQYQLQGASLNVLANTYNTSVVFTVTRR